MSATLHSTQVRYRQKAHSLLYTMHNCRSPSVFECCWFPCCQQRLDQGAEQTGFCRRHLATSSDKEDCSFGMSVVEQKSGRTFVHALRVLHEPRRSVYSPGHSPNNISCTPSSSSSEARSSTVHRSRSTSLQDEGCVTDGSLPRDEDAALAQTRRRGTGKGKHPGTRFNTLLFTEAAQLKAALGLGMGLTLTDALLQPICITAKSRGRAQLVPACTVAFT